MQRKLTLSVDESLVKFGKEWTKKHGKTLSGLLEEALRTIRKLEETRTTRTISPEVKSLIGLTRGANEDDYGDYLEKKYP